MIASTYRYVWCPAELRLSAGDPLAWEDLENWQVRRAKTKSEIVGYSLATIAPEDYPETPNRYFFMWEENPSTPRV